MIARRLPSSAVGCQAIRSPFCLHTQAQRAVTALPQNLKMYHRQSGCGYHQPYSCSVYRAQWRFYSMANVNPISLSAFNSNHESYDIYRSSYPKPAVELAAVLNKGQHILEVGAGTGKFTSQILSHLPADRLVVLEPSAGMLSSFKKRHPQIKAIQAPSDNIPLDDNSFDTIYVAQAFHWFASRDTLQEFYRVLRPHGTIVLVWNFEDEKHMSPGGWQQRTTELVWKYDSKVPQYRHKHWERVLRDSTDLFAQQCQRFFPYRTLVKSPEALWHYWETRSYIHDLDELQQTQLKEQILDIARSSPTPLVAARGCHIVWMKSQKPMTDTDDILHRRI